MKTTPLFYLGLVLCGVSAQAQTGPSPDERAIWSLEHSWNRAYVDGDAAKLAEVESPNYVFTESDGTVHTRADEIAETRSNTTHFTEMSLHEATVRITGDTAVVTGRLVVAGRGDDGPFGEIKESTDTLLRVNGVWQALASSEISLASGAESAVTPLWRDGGDWLQRHAGFVAEAKKGGVDLVFLGDSITDLWRSRGRAVWDKYYGGLHAANLGIGGDRTQHVLWRLDHGEIAGLRPKVVVLMIGTNNTGIERDGLTPRNSPAEAAEGVLAIVNDLRRQLPEAQILLLAIFPRGHTPDDPSRLQVAAVNRIIGGLSGQDHVHFLDIGAKFLTPDGLIQPEIMPDYLHPSVRGFEIWAQAIQAPLARLLGLQG